jgi:hypothetical protein
MYSSSAPQFEDDYIAKQAALEGTRFKIVDGEHRWRALLLLGEDPDADARAKVPPNVCCNILFHLEVQLSCDLNPYLFFPLL